MGRRAKTRNGHAVADLRPYDRGILGKEWLMGYLNCSHFPYAIWDPQGKADYVHNMGNYKHINEFDLLWVEI
jgi:hypothetical protein